jgi:hypothetical protein
MNKFMIRGTMLVDVKRAVPNNTSGKATGVSIDFGAAFAIFDNLEVGVNNYRLGSTPANTGQAMFPITVAPRGTFGDMPLYVRYSFLRKRYFEMALDFVFLLPTWTNLAVTVGLPMRLRLRDVFTVDTGTELVLLTNGAGLNAEVPLKATYNITPAGFIFGDSGFSFQNIARNLTGGSYRDSSLTFPVDRNQVFVPLGIGGGYTHVMKNIVMIDVFARFGRFKPRCPGLAAARPPRTIHARSSSSAASPRARDEARRARGWPCKSTARRGAGASC